MQRYLSRASFKITSMWWCLDSHCLSVCQAWLFYNEALWIYCILCLEITEYRFFCTEQYTGKFIKLKESKFRQFTCKHIIVPYKRSYKLCPHILRRIGPTIMWHDANQFNAWNIITLIYCHETYLNPSNRSLLADISTFHFMHRT